MAADAKHRLREALEAHTFTLETERDAAPEHDQAVLDRRLDAARTLLEWIQRTLAFGSVSNATSP
jgi:hypothetical protein